MAERLAISLHALLRDRGGAAAVEFAIAAGMLVVGVFNAIDVGAYMYRRMEVENAAQAGARAAWKTCYDQSYMLPATISCPGLNAAITTAVQNTSLGIAVTLSAGYPTEGYYCTTSTNTLMAVGSLSSKPANCSAAGNASVSPGDYIQVGVTYPYTSLVPGLSVISASGIFSVTAVSWMRLG
jgi:hypothetical protein